MSGVFKETRAHGGVGRLARFERALLRIHGVILGAFVLFILLPLSTADAPRAVPAHLAVAILYIAVALDLQFRGERPSHLLALSLPLLLIPAFVRQHLPGDVSSGYVVAAFAVSAARLLRRTWFLASVPLIGGSALVLRALAGGRLGAGVDEVLIAVGITFAGAAALVDAAEEAARRSISFDERTRVQRAALLQLQAENEAVARAGRALHDHVLSALRAVTDPHAAPEQVRRACASAVAEVRAATTASVARPEAEGREDHVGVTWLTDLISRIQTDSPVQVEFVIGTTSPRRRVPAAAGDALCRAAGEALRNVARHAGTGRAVVTVREDDDVFVLEVVDEGVGLPAHHVPGYGLQHSIHGAMAAAGGRADVQSGNPAGTVVRLSLPLDAQPRSSRLQHAYSQTMRAVGDAAWLRGLVWPFVITWSAVGLHETALWPRPWVSLLLLALFVTLSVSVTRSLARRAPSVGRLAGFTAAIAALLALSLALLPDGSMLDYRSWPVGYIAVPLLVVALVLPGWYAVAVLLPPPALVLGFAALDPALAGHAVPWGSVNAVLSVPVFGWLTGAMMRWIGRGIEHEEREYTATTLALASQRSAAVISSLHLDHTRREVVPWLTRIAEGEVDPTTPEAADRAAGFIAEVRDDLYAPGFFDASLRASAAAFRSAGGSLLLRPGIRPGAWNRTIGRVAHAVLAAADGRHIVTVTPPSDDGGPCRVAVVPPLPGLDLSGIAADVHHDDSRTVVTFDDLPLTSAEGR